MIKFKIRNERKSDFRTVELLTRMAFWNVYIPGCDEHYLVHILREHKDFVQELDFVAETDDGKIIGNIMYTKAGLAGENGIQTEILTFGPISVHPDYQRMGVGKALLEKSFAKAVELGYPAIVIFGNPYNYVSRGFISCKKYNVSLEDGTFPAAMLVKELKQGTFDGKRWFYHGSPAYEVSEYEANEFDKQFEPMKKEFRPSQEEFFIYKHSILPD